jgi:hypothetical protein
MYFETEDQNNWGEGYIFSEILNLHQLYNWTVILNLFNCCLKRGNLFHIKINKWAGKADFWEKFARHRDKQ